MIFTRRDALKTAIFATGATLAAPAIMRHAALGADPIKIAGIHDASGGLDTYGLPMIACLDYAVDEINASGGLLGREVLLKNYDPQSNIQLYTQFATEAATKEKVAVVHGGITSASREAIRPILKKFNTLYFYNTQYEGGVCDRNEFSTGSTPAQNVNKLVPYVLKNWGKKVYVIAADYNYGQITSKWIAKYTREGGGEVLATEFFPLDVTNFGPLISKIQAAKPDAVISALVGGAHVSFYRQWAASGMKKQIPLASTTFGGGNESVVLSPEEGDGIVSAFSYFQEVDTPENKAFLEGFHKKLGDKAPYLGAELAMRTYIGVKLWAEGVKRAKSVDRMEVIKALESGISMDTPAGKTTLDAKTHHTTVDVFLATCSNHGFKVIETFPQQPPADTASVCDLIAHPNENKQYIVDIKI
jgi:branched-chain amino acid transport system substrate-binding protein